MQTLVLVCQYTCTVSPGLYMVSALFYLVTGLLLHMHSQSWVVHGISFLLSGDWSVTTHAQSVLGCTWYQLFYLVTGLLLHMHSQYWVVHGISSLLSGDWSVTTHAQSVLGCTWYLAFIRWLVCQYTCTVSTGLYIVWMVCHTHKVTIHTELNTALCFNEAFCPESTCNTLWWFTWQELVFRH